MKAQAGTRPLRQDCRPRLREGVRLHRDRLSGQPVLLFPEGIMQLSPTAAAILRLCDGQCNVGEISAALAETFAAPLDVLAADVAEFLQRLHDRQLLHGSSAEVS